MATLDSKVEAWTGSGARKKTGDEAVQQDAII